MTPQSELEVDVSGAPPAARKSPSWRAFTSLGAGSLAPLVLVGILLYVAIDAALVFLRPQFSLLHSAESDYGSLGSWDWLMDLNFLLRGALSFATVRAITPGGES